MKFLDFLNTNFVLISFKFIFEAAKKGLPKLQRDVLSKGMKININFNLFGPTSYFSSEVGRSNGLE